MPFGLYALTTSSEPGMAVAADRNPWLNSPGGEAKEMALFIPTGDRDAVKAGNAVTHEQEGQNVLFLDGHVAFETESFCGLDNDNIYTWWDGGDIRRGGKPGRWSEPKGRRDSYLVHDSMPSKPKTVTKQAEAVDSADLKQTTVVATLDCPMPDHKNVIWCATFQMTWDELKNDIIGESLLVPDAAELSARLNRGEFPTENLESESLYAAVGIVKDGIVEHIQKGMARRFSSEPVPVFDELYRLSPAAREHTIVSYSYLKTDIGFKHTFYNKEGAFSFEDSNGERTNITSFCGHTEGSDPNEGLVREQVEILYYEQSDPAGTAEFAVDLCKHTNPYKVVLALVPRYGTLADIVTSVEQKMAEFKNEPDYEVLRKLGPGSGNRPPDRLIVPDVLYKLTHRFAELKGKQIKNQEWKDYWFLEAREIVDFTLSRTGVVLKSEARLGAAPPFSMPPRRLEEPRYFYFNRPFLIYVKKRGAEFSPFFVMWVDNAELMNAF
jgi:prepilin-type processing-associated H-X9-DG protein